LFLKIKKITLKNNKGYGVACEHENFCVYVIACSCDNVAFFFQEGTILICVQ
jgi:hypothetical protein